MCKEVLLFVTGNITGVIEYKMMYKFGSFGIYMEFCIFHIISAYLLKIYFLYICDKEDMLYSWKNI